MDRTLIYKYACLVLAAALFANGCYITMDRLYHLRDLRTAQLQQQAQQVAQRAQQYEQAVSLLCGLERNAEECKEMGWQAEGSEE